MANLLVTGGAGFIGSAFVRSAVAAGHHVIVLDKLTYAGHRKNLEGVKANLVVGDILDGTLVAKLLHENQIDSIVHLAAESHVDRSIDKPALFIETNITGTYVLLEAALNHWKRRASPPEFRFVHVSTDEVFGALGAGGIFTEGSPYNPSSPYSSSKAAADHLVRAWHKTYGLPVVITVSSNNYGPRQNREKLIPFMIASALSGKPLTIYGSGKQSRDWLHVEDHSAGLLLALERGVPGGTYCFAGREERRNLDLVTMIAEILDELSPRSDGKPHSSAVTHVEDRPGHDFRYALDDSNARRELGFAPQMRLHEGLRQTVQWCLDNPSWPVAK